MASCSNRMVDLDDDELLDFGNLSSTENSTPVSDGDHCEKLIFVELLREFPVILDKSQTPAVKSQREKSIEVMLSKYTAATGRTLDKLKLYKRLANLKQQVKKKLDFKQTGNKRITLDKSEQIFADLLHAEENPAVSKIGSALEVGLSDKSAQIENKPKSLHTASNVLKASNAACTPFEFLPKTNDSSSKKQHKRLACETSETENLTLPELQRLVLLENLSLIRMKKQKLVNEGIYKSMLYTVTDSSVE